MMINIHFAVSMLLTTEISMKLFVVLGVIANISYIARGFPTTLQYLKRFKMTFDCLIIYIINDIDFYEFP